jgi:CubicO group peptidase (beta-lactamase class C family)
VFISLNYLPLHKKKHLNPLPTMSLLKKILWSILIFFIVINLAIILFGKTYLYKGIVNTYLVGRSGPSISEYYIFHNRTIAAGEPQSWQFDTQYGNVELADNYLQILDSISTVSFLVAQSESIIYEKYFNNYSPDSITNSFSAGKSIVGLLIGIAIEESFINSLDQSAGDFIPSMKEDGKEIITIRHLLTMSSGLNWIESGANPFSDNAEAYYGSNLSKLVDRLQLINTPGEEFIYLSGNTQILGMILTQATGMTLSEYASTRLWSKIGTENDALWNLDSKEGMEKAYCCFYATSRDFAKLGQLILNQGSWNEEQIIPLQYLEETLTPANLTDKGRPNKRYGYHWWMDEYNNLTLYYARGILGQYIIIIPEKELVIFRAGHTRMPESETGHPKDLYIYVDAALSLLNE